MKTFFVILAVCVASSFAALTPEQQQKLNQYKAACLTETGATEEALTAAKNAPGDVTDEKVKCFTACLLKKLAIMNADGTFNVEVARAKIPTAVSQDKAEEIINKCKDLKGSTDCETGAKLFTCYLNNKNVEIPV